MSFSNYYLRHPLNLVLPLGRRGFLNFLSDKRYCELAWKSRFKTKIDWDSPKTFNEKLQWLKIYDHKESYIPLVDKYDVRNIVKKNMGEEYLIPIYGVWNSVDDIDFAKLPNQFVLKCTHDSGSVIVCRNKENFDIASAKKKLTKALKKNGFWYSREWPYKHLKPRIIAEKYMFDDLQPSLIDYKFFCFNGEPRFLYVSQGLENHATASISFYDLEGKQMPFSRSDYKSMPGNLKKPVNFEKMIELARSSARAIDSPFIRVDLYEINKKIFFSEYTFFPCAAMLPFSPLEWDKKIGDMLDISGFKR